MLLTTLLLYAIALLALKKLFSAALSLYGVACLTLLSSPVLFYSSGLIASSLGVEGTFMGGFFLTFFVGLPLTVIGAIGLLIGSVANWLHAEAPAASRTVSKE